MLSSSLVTLGLAVIGAYANPTVRAAGGLEVYLSTSSNNIASLSDLRVIAAVKNTGDKDLKILKSGTVLDDEQRGQSFIITKDGKEVPFTGTEVPASTDYLSEDDLVVIRAGENATAAHDVAFALYDFSASGPGTFTFDPVSKFKVIGPNETTCDEAADAHSISITIADVSKRELKFEKRRIISCEDEGKAGFIGAAVLEATVLASWAATYIEDNKGGPLFQKYFGDNDFKAIHSNFLTLAKSDKSSLSLNCANCGGSELAQSSNQEFKVHFCSAFFNQLPIGSLCGQSPKTTFGARNLRGGVSLRYMARALIQGVIDGGDGCPDTQSGNGFERRLSDRNYECFATQLYFETQCTHKG